MKTFAYKRETRHGHHRSDPQGHVLQHVLIAEAALGKPLPCGAEVHHVDGDASNNARRNLVICQDRAYHRLLHVRVEIVKAGGDPNVHRVCSTCQKLKPLDEFNRCGANKATGRQTACRDCSHAYTKTYVRRPRRRA